MGALGFGKLGEGVTVTMAFTPERVEASSATVYWGGAAITTAGGMIDTRDHDSAVFAIQVGTFAGAYSMANDVYESTTNDWTNATLMAGARFTVVTNSSDENQYKGMIDTKKSKRYIGLRSEFTTAPATVDFSAVCMLGENDTQISDASYDFDV